MPSQAEIARALDGALLLAKGDVRGLDRFDLSIEGFWASFAAALVAAPAYALILAEQYAVTGGPQGLLGTLLAEAIAYGGGRIAFPVAAIFLTRLLGLGTRYIPLIVALNWAAVLQIALYAALVVVTLLLPADLRTLLLFLATIAVLVYQWFVIRTALRTTGTTAFGLVVIDVLLSVAVSRVLDALLQPA